MDDLAPSVICLQTIDDNGDPLDDWTWCADPIYNQDTRYVRADIVHDLSTWAAAINWDGSPNLQGWLDGLRERVEFVQALTKAR